MFRAFFLFLSVLPLMAQATLAQENEGSWATSDFSTLENKEVEGTFLTLFADPLCSQDNLNNDLCIDYGWREACLEIYFIFGLGNDLPYLLSEEKFPVLKIGKTNKFDINTKIKEENNEGYNPRAYTERAVLWRIQIGTPDSFRDNEKGMIYSLITGKELKIFFPILDGPVMRSKVPLDNLKPLLEAVMEKAETSRPHGQCAE